MICLHDKFHIIRLSKKKKFHIIRLGNHISYELLLLIEKPIVLIHQYYSYICRTVHSMLEEFLLVLFATYWFSFQTKEAKYYSFKVLLVWLLLLERSIFIKDWVSGQSWVLHCGHSQAGQWGGNITNCSRWKTCWSLEQTRKPYS